MEGSGHGFLTLRTMEGKTLAVGDLTQVIRGDRVVSHLVFRFKDGSIDDETAVFSQRDNLRLISNRHIQKGPMFPNATDVSITPSTGQVTVHATDERGKTTVETATLELPPDLANGMVLPVLKNIRGDAGEIKVSYLAATPKPRLVKLSIIPQSEDSFSVAGYVRKATRFLISVELGGVAGALAPFLGKKPADTFVWVMRGQAPAFIRLEGPLYMDGPIWSIQPAAPNWQSSPQQKRSDTKNGH
jgi:hypothetical protein